MTKTSCVTNIARALITQYFCTVVANKYIHSLSLSIVYNDKHVNQRHKLYQFDRMKVINSQNISLLERCACSDIKDEFIIRITYCACRCYNKFIKKYYLQLKKKK